MTRAVRSLLRWAHRMISDAYGSGGLQIARPVVMMASADEGGAEGLGRRRNLDNLQLTRRPSGTMRERSGESGPLHCTARK